MLIDVGTSIDWHSYLSKFGFVPEQKKNKRKKIKQQILNVMAAFDIETSTVWLNPDKKLYDVHSFMYVWQMQIEDYTIMGRTWDEFFSFLKTLREAIGQIRQEAGLETNPLLVLFVHNLAYEFTFLSGLYPFRNEECFFRDVRKPIYCRMFDTFELRCSYIQTNLSLSALCKQTGVAEKLSGQKFDYDKVRFPWTELTAFEVEYCTRDVQSLVEAMRYRIQRGGDTLLTMPITSTGYVRRECKEALKDHYLDLRELKPSEKEYRLLRKAFRGGNTHANRYMVGKIIEDVYSYDISSSYPTQQLTHPFPVKPYRWLELSQRTPERRIERVFTFIGLGYSVIGTYQFKGLRLKNHREPIPYISLSKCDAFDFVLDNGRILEASYCELSCTEIDLGIILDQYTFDYFDVIEAMVAQQEMLPIEYREVIQSYYNKKTALKGDDSEDGKYMYVKSKNMLNAVYGMSATDPIHQDITYIDGDYTISDYDSKTSEEIQKVLKNAAFPYQWGVVTTSWARKQLQDAIKLCGDRIIYCDTDSVKVKGPINIDLLNNPLKERAIQFNAYADDMKGRRHYIGLFEDESKTGGPCYEQFITQGAKRYAYISGGKMGITVAGVSKKINEETGIPFAVEELKTLDRFRVGMVWSKAGGTISVYNDHADREYTDSETGRTVHITKNVAIVPSTYEMTYSKDYRLLLNEIQLYGDYQKERE